MVPNIFNPIMDSFLEFANKRRSLNRGATHAVFFLEKFEFVTHTEFI